MEDTWMIFAHEGNASHMWYCGTAHYIDLETGETVWDLDSNILHDVLHSKKKNFTINKTRYVVVARGKRYEP